MSKSLKLLYDNASNPKFWLVIGIGVAGIVVLAETRRRRRRAAMMCKEDFGAFIERFELLPFPQPPPPAAKQSLSGLTFAIKDMFVSRHLILLLVFRILLTFTFLEVCM